MVLKSTVEIPIFNDTLIAHNRVLRRAKPEILQLGRGQHEAAMIATIRKSGYTGPIGILDHRNDTDTEIALRENLEGLQNILKK